MVFYVGKWQRKMSFFLHKIIPFTIVLYIAKNNLKVREVIYLRELFIEKVIEESEGFLDNNQIIK